MGWPNVLNALVKVIGFIMVVLVSAGVIWVVYRAFAKLLNRLIGDETVARALTVLGMILLGLKGLIAALSYITQPELRYLHTGLTDLLSGMAGVVQWMVLIAVILFVGYALQGYRGPAEEEEEEE